MWSTTGHYEIWRHVLPRYGTAVTLNVGRMGTDRRRTGVWKTLWRGSAYMLFALWGQTGRHTNNGTTMSTYAQTCPRPGDHVSREEFVFVFVCATCFSARVRCIPKRQERKKKKKKRKDALALMAEECMIGKHKQDSEPAERRYEGGKYPSLALACQLSGARWLDQERERKAAKDKSQSRPAAGMRAEKWVSLPPTDAACLLRRRLFGPLWSTTTTSSAPQRPCMAHSLHSLPAAAHRRLAPSDPHATRPAPVRARTCFCP